MLLIVHHFKGFTELYCLKLPGIVNSLLQFFNILKKNTVVYIFGVLKSFVFECFLCLKLLGYHLGVLVNLNLVIERAEMSLNFVSFTLP